MPAGKDEIKQNLIRTVRAISHDIGSRSYLEPESLEQTAGFIEKQFISYGINAKRQTYEAKGKTYHNIYSEVRGTTEKDEILVIGAHYDTVAGTPGADDNASGIAGMLELSRLVSENPVSHTIIFSAFTLEEPPFFHTNNMGSYVFAENLAKKNIKVKGMISLEMIGYFSNIKGSQIYPLPVFRWFYPDTGDFIAFVGNIQSRSFTNRFAEIFKKVSSMRCESLNTVSLVPGVSFSDHHSFWRFQYPAFMATDTSFYRNPHYHRSGDTADTLDYGKMSELVLGMYETLKNF